MLDNLSINSDSDPPGAGSGLGLGLSVRGETASVVGGGTNTNSGSTNSLNSNLANDPAAKYSKLATEYAKLRAHFGVLKKAVLEERGKAAVVTEELRYVRNAEGVVKLFDHLFVVTGKKSCL